MDKIAELVRDQIQKVRTTAGNKETARPVGVRSQVVTGYPSEEILKYAEGNNIDIILMATHGASGVRRWAIGSVAYQVLHASRVPVWLVRSGIPQETIYDKWPQRTILVPLDGSQLAESAIPHAVALAGQRGIHNVEILLLSVYAPAIYPAVYFFQTAYPPTVPLKYEDFIKQETDQAQERCLKYLKTISDQLTSKGFSVRTECVMGNAADEIIRYANKNPFQVIVMASHGRSGIRHLTFGSVAERVLLECNTPIFLITPAAS